MNYEKQLEYLLEEAQSNLTLYQNGQDDFALERYETIMEHVKSIRTIINDKRQYSRRSNK